jgi:hypothetical protein
MNNTKQSQINDLSIIKTSFVNSSKIIISKVIDGTKIRLNINSTHSIYIMDELIKEINTIVNDPIDNIKVKESAKNLKELLSNNKLAIIDHCLKLKYPKSNTYDIINWSRLKYLFKDNSTNIEIIKLINAINFLRRISIDFLKKSIIYNFINECYTEAGSTNPTSDLDFSYINILNPIQSVYMMDIFYKIFYELFGGTSADVFDVNYYICSSILQQSCYNANKISPSITRSTLTTTSELFKDIIESLTTINYGISDLIIDDIAKLFEMCDIIDCKISSNSSTKTDCTNKLSQMFVYKEVYNIKGEKKYLYFLDFPQNKTLDKTLDKNYQKIYDSYQKMTQYMCLVLLNNCIRKELTHNKLASTNKLAYNKLIPTSKNKLYDFNVKYSFLYYKILDFISSDSEKYCEPTIKFKTIFMLKTIMSLMSVSANESYVYDLTVAKIVYGDKLESASDLEKFICFMDHFRFILEQYSNYLENNLNSTQIQISKYKLFDSICKYYVRIMDLGDEYMKVINEIIDRSDLEDYNKNQRATGTIIDFATLNETIKNKTSTIFVNLDTKTKTKTKTRPRRNAIIELPPMFNPVVNKVYEKFKDKEVDSMIKPLLDFFERKFQNILEDQTINGEKLDIMRICADFYIKLNNKMYNK